MRGGIWVLKKVDENGIEILPPFSERPKGYKPPPWLKKEIRKNGTVTFGQYFSTKLKRVFTVPVLTMIGIWIIVYYQISSHNHYIKLTKSTSSSPYVYQPIRLTWETTKNVNR